MQRITGRNSGNDKEIHHDLCAGCRGPKFDFSGGVGEDRLLEGMRVLQGCVDVEGSSACAGALCSCIYTK